MKNIFVHITDVHEELWWSRNGGAIIMEFIYGGAIINESF